MKMQGKLKNGECNYLVEPINQQKLIIVLAKICQVLLDQRKCSKDRSETKKH